MLYLPLSVMLVTIVATPSLTVPFPTTFPSTVAVTGPFGILSPVVLSVTLAVIVTFPAVLFVTFPVVFVGRFATSIGTVTLAGLYVSLPG